MLKMDRKFVGALQKVKDGTTVPDDQWIVFLAKDDAFALHALPAYLVGCQRLGADTRQLQMVRELLERVLAWRAAHPDLCKVPDAAGEQTLDGPDDPEMMIHRKRG